jgi:Plasmid pRiA4b ORF-3-like protein
MNQRSRSRDVVVQMKIKLLGVSTPPAWRRLRVRADTRLDRLHEIIQAAFAWENYHMHCFSSDGEVFGVPDSELGFIDECGVGLEELVGGVGDRLRYTYDFGDGWEHDILVEDLLERDAELRYPGLVASRGACPPEDCGGARGYAELKTILADPDDEEHHEMLDWLGLDNASEFDPGAVPTDQIEYALALSGVRL